MHRAELYSKSNSLTTSAVSKILKEYYEKMQWRENSDSFIDLGCGDGNLTSFIKKYVPCKQTTFVAVDINENMIKLAKEHHAEENIEFKVLDIVSDLPENLKSGFNHVFSFYTIQLIMDQEKVFRNIYDLLTTGGDCLLLIIKHVPFYDLLIETSNNNKWKQWIGDLNKFLSRYYKIQNPDIVITRMLENIGFKDIDVQTKLLSYTMNNGMEFKNLFQAIEPYNMPKNVYEEFALDSVKVAQRIGILDKSEMRYEDRQNPVIFNYEALIVFAKK